MFFGILGPLAVAHAAGATRLSSSTREGRILGVLLLNANRSVEEESLIDMLYGEQPPITARQQVQNCTSRLIRLLDRLWRPGRLHRLAAGYRFDVDETELDALAFESALAHARHALRQDEFDHAAECYRHGLALWRGQVLGGADAGDFSPLSTRLTELRRTATEEWLGVELAAGRANLVSAELAAAAAEHPLSEGLVGLQMRALAESGRIAEALDVFRRTRSRLVAEHGVEPGRELAALHAAILRRETTGNAGPPTVPHASSPARYRGVEDIIGTLTATMSGLDDLRAALGLALASLTTDKGPAPYHPGPPGARPPRERSALARRASAG